MQHYKTLLTILIISLISGCNITSSSNVDKSNDSYTLHKNITVTIFWTGEPSSEDNGGIANLASAWDSMWMINYGGVDTPDKRDGYYPAGFTPNENPFYFALPYNDFDENGLKKENLESYIPWAVKDDNSSLSICKNRWIKIIKGNKVAYAQWEDVGPFGEDDKEYVFGTSLPKNQINQNAGLDVSPAVRDYLGLNDIDTVDWQFVDQEDVPDGPWKEIVTTSNVNWVNWYKPDINTTWHWQLQGTINTSYNVKLYDIDLFDTDTATIQSLKADGKRVICYFSAGSYENWREDSNSFPAEILGNDLDGWAGEKWLDIRSDLLKPIMLKRLDLAKEKGCDGVEPDNVDGYLNNTGFPLTAEDQLAYNKFLAKEAKKRGLSIALKNDLDQVKTLEPFFDFSINEQCHKYNECDKLKPFIDANKPVLNAEYAIEYVDNIDGARDLICSESKNLQFKTLILPIELDDSFRYSCDE
jgi:endo-alpha-1,4-polygalactosaminidase (GH114 family)